MLVKSTPTGRKWGDKVEPSKQTRHRIEGIDFVSWQDDRWQGPNDGGGKGQYHRCAWLVPASDLESKGGA